MMRFTIMFLLAGYITCFGQKKPKEYAKDGKFGFFAGVNNSTFTREEAPTLTSIVKTASPGINTGIHFRPYNLKILSSIIQISYTQKGATELFKVPKIEENVSVRTNLSYCQIDIVPIEFVPFYQKDTSPFIAGGIFYNKLLSSKVRYQYTDKFNINDDINDFALDFEPDNKKDMGYMLMVGIKAQNLRIEYKNEIGTKYLFTNSKIRSHSNALTVRFSL